MIKFDVSLPFIVPIRPEGHGKVVDTNALWDFWRDTIGEDLADARGCYVFGFRAGRGITPVYVGRATKTFRQECFAQHKIGKLNTGLLHYKRGTLVLFLLAAERRRGKPNKRAVADLERFLIENALARNDSLLNIQHTKEEKEWCIAGVFRSGKGKPSAAATKFRKALGL